MLRAGSLMAALSIRKARSTNLRPFGTSLPASRGGNSGQATAFLVQVNSVSFFRNLSISKAIIRAVAMAVFIEASSASKTDRPPF